MSVNLKVVFHKIYLVHSWILFLKYELQKVKGSYYPFILLKSWKSLELVSSLRNWTKNVLEMSGLRYPNIWPNLILIMPRIQKK